MTYGWVVPREAVRSTGALAELVGSDVKGHIGYRAIEILRGSGQSNGGWWGKLGLRRGIGQCHPRWVVRVGNAQGSGLQGNVCFVGIRAGPGCQGPVDSQSLPRRIGFVVEGIDEPRNIGAICKGSVRVARAPIAERSL